MALKPIRKTPAVDRELALAALAWVLLASPALALWARPVLGWFAPYAVWLGLIAGAALLAKLRPRRDGR